MSKRIIGAFKSEEEALETIDALEAEGYLTKDLQILTTNKDADNFRGSTNIFVESEEAESEKDAKPSLVDKVKSAIPFVDDPGDPSLVRKKLVEMGVSHDEAVKFAPPGDTGSIFIIADENPDGNAAGGTTKKKLVVTEEASVQDSAVNSPDDELIEQTVIDEEAGEQETVVTETTGETIKDEEQNSFQERVNPELDKNSQSPAENTTTAQERENETSVAPNPAIGGIDSVDGNTDAETIRKEGTPNDHAHTPLDKTEEDMKNRKETRRDNGSNNG